MNTVREMTESSFGRMPAVTSLHSGWFCSVERRWLRGGEEERKYIKELRMEGKCSKFLMLVNGVP